MSGRVPSLAGLRVMVVEDEHVVSMLIEEMLSDEGCTVVGPYDRVQDALAAAAAETLDLAVLDVNVAGVEAYPIAEALAARRIPFLFLSGYGRDAIPPDRPDWLVCNKPFTIDQLLALMEVALTSGGRAARA